VTAFTDSRIDESSGLAYSQLYYDLMYTINDEPTTPHIFAIRPSTGDTIGTCSLDGVTPSDPEAISVDGFGQIWYADIGDNSAVRDWVNVYSRAEPGPGNRGDLAFRKYKLQYPGGARNAETFLTNPTNRDRYIISKQSTSRLYKLPSHLESGGAMNDLELLSPTFGDEVTDGTFTPDGRFVLLRKNGQNTHVYVHDVLDDWDLVETLTVSASGQSQCEGITVELPFGTSFWTSSEGQYSTLHNPSMPSAYRPLPITYPGSPCS
jgi:hypothetical protein